MEVNLRKHWDKLYETLTNAVGGEVVITVCGVIGVAIIVIGVIGFIIGKIRSRGGGNQMVSGQQLAWALLAGGVLAAPTVVIPILLTVVEIIIKLVLAFLGLFG